MADDAVRDAFEVREGGSGFARDHLNDYVNCYRQDRWLTWLAAHEHARAQMEAAYRKGFNDGQDAAAEYIEQLTIGIFATRRLPTPAEIKRYLELNATKLPDPACVKVVAWLAHLAEPQPTCGGEVSRG